MSCMVAMQNQGFTFMIRTLKNHWWPILALVSAVLLAAALRLIRLDAWPVSLYWEEVALGYDAYSLVKTGLDHHGQPWPIVAFESFGDFKPSGYFYMIVPWLQILPLGAWAVRLPSAIAGVITVLATAWFASSWSQSLLGRQRQLSNNEKWWWAATVAGVAAISPWLIQFSRGGWEVNMATAWLTLAIAVASWELSRYDRPPRVIDRLGWGVVILLCVASMYTYHATRVIAPVMGLWLAVIAIWQWWPKGWLWLLKTWGVWAVGYALILGITIWPLWQASTSPVVQQRIAQTSLLARPDHILESAQLQAEAADPWAKFFYHRQIVLGREIVKNYLSHLSPQFLFIRGDHNARHSIQFMGQLYYLEAVALVVGTLVLVKRRTRGAVLILGWWWFSLVPAAITFGSPHALRTLPGAPALMIVIATGWWAIGEWWAELLAKWVKFKSLRALTRWSRQVFVVTVIGAYICQLALFWRYYTQIYPAEYGADWQVGYQELIPTLMKLRAESSEQRIWITRDQGRPLMYYWFYGQVDPLQVQTAEATSKLDDGEFVEYDNWVAIKSVAEITGPGLVASNEQGWLDMINRGHVETLTTIRDRRGHVIWVVYRYQP